MPFQMKIQPIDSYIPEESFRLEPVKPVVKSRLKRLFERQFLRTSSAEKVGVEEPHPNKDCSNGFGDWEPSSVCLAKMVQSFIEDNNEKQSAPVRCGGRSCFNGNCNDSSEEESDSYGSFGESNHSSSSEAIDILKSLVLCASVRERNLLADTAKIVEKDKVCKRKDDLCRKVVADGLLALGYDASICKSRWEKSSTSPAGEYEYIDVIVEGERYLVDIDFRSEFEIARSTKSYKSVLQSLPHIFVGKSDRLQKIVAMVSEAAKQSLKKKGMHIPPWRKADYVKAKWLSPYTRIRSSPTLGSRDGEPEKMRTLAPVSESESSRGRGSSVDEVEFEESVFALSLSSGEDEKPAAAKEWKPAEVKPNTSSTGVKIMAGLSSVIEDEK